MGYSPPASNGDLVTEPLATSSRRGATSISMVTSGLNLGRGALGMNASTCADALAY